MATDLGKVGMRTRGSWNSSATYEVLDIVTYNNTLYIAKQNVPANTLPTNTTYWEQAINLPSAISDFAVKSSITAGGTKKLTVSNSSYAFIIYGLGWNAQVRSVLFHVSGYANGSYSTITNLTGQTAVTVSGSSSSLEFTVTNSGAQAISIYYLALTENTIGTWSDS